jgi:hypothetical protein
VNRLRLVAAAGLLAGLVLAVGTPAYVGWAAPHLAGYLHHPAIFLVQALPYSICAVFWLPWRRPDTDRAAAILALLLLIAAVVVYGPMLLRPGARGGDMIGLAFTAVSLVSTLVLLVLSVTAFIGLRLSAARRSR